MERYAVSLHKYIVVVTAFLLLLSFFIVNLRFFLWPVGDFMSSAVLPAVVVDLTNSERGSLAKTPLSRNSRLDEAARLKAEHMAEKHYFAHHSPDGVSPWFWFKQAGYDFVHAGENLAVYFDDSKEVVDAWMNSPGHRANIVDQKFSEIGVGTAEGVYNGHDTVFVVQLFAHPSGKTLAQTNIFKEEVVPPEVGVLEREPSVLAHSVEETQSNSITPVSEVSLVEEEVKVKSEDSPIVLSDREELSSAQVEKNTVLANNLANTDITKTDNISMVVDNEIIEESPILEEFEGNKFITTYIATSLIPLSEISYSSTNNPATVLGYNSNLSKSEVNLNLFLQSFYLVIAVLSLVTLFFLILNSVYKNRIERVLFGTTLYVYILFLLFIHVNLTGGIIVAYDEYVIYKQLMI